MQLANKAMHRSPPQSLILKSRSHWRTAVIANVTCKDLNMRGRSIRYFVGALFGVLLLELAAVGQNEILHVPRPSFIPIPARPDGKYEFISSIVREEQKEEIRNQIPFEFIELKQWGQGSPMDNKPGTEYRILFWRNGKAEYEGTSGVKMIGLHRGEIELTEFGRIALLLELFEFQSERCDVGFEVQISHPTVAAINVGFDRGLNLTRRNANGFGDYRFWLTQSAIENAVSSIDWKIDESK
jgi:hypothetical protein